MNVQKVMDDKRITDDALIELIKPGHRIFFSSGPVMPVTTISCIIDTPHANLQDLEFIQIAPMNALFFKKATIDGKYRVKTFMVGENMAQQYAETHVDFVPSSIAELPYLFASGAVETDVAVIQVSVPDKKGNVSLGPVHDITKLVIENAALVIAEINPRVPVTHGDTRLSLKAFDHIIERDMALLTAPAEQTNAALIEIGRNVGRLIEDGATLSMGMGALHNAIAAALTDKNEIAVCSHVISDWIIDLIASGATARKSVFNSSGPISAIACIGSEALYRYIDNNRAVAVLPLMNSQYQNVLSKIPRLTGIINVDRIDIAADAVAVRGSEYQVDGFDSKLNFALAATNSRDGKSIVVLPSTDAMGNSNICMTHAQGSGRIRSLLGCARYVVSEYGVAALFGKTIRERAIAMIDIAHPRHRQALLEEAKAAGIIYPDQIYNVTCALNYPRQLERTHRFSNMPDVFIRPIKTSDEDMMRRLFYRISEDTVYMRYHAAIRTMPHSRMQTYVNIDYVNTISLVGIIQRRGIEQIITEVRFAYSRKSESHELALIVDEEFQGRGIGTYMLDRIVEIAKARRIPKLTGTTHPGNTKIARVLEKTSHTPFVFEGQHENEVTFYIEEAPPDWEELEAEWLLRN